MIFLFLLIQTVIALDPVALISDEVQREKIFKAQRDEINRRSELGTTNCDELFADLPYSGDGKTPFLTAYGTIQSMMTGIRYWNHACLNQLVQNLALSNQPIALRISRELLSTDLQKNPTRDVIFCGSPSSGLEQILNLSQNVERIRKCAPLEQGKWKTVGGTGASGIDYSYGLIQEAPKKIRAVLNVNFTGSNNGVNGAAMLQRARICLNSVQESLKGPNGEQLTINLLNPEEARKIPSNLRPKRTSIVIAPENTRSHSKSYSANAQCSTIIHEVMHLLGLCDEYPGEGDNYPCRAVGRRNSIMNNHVSAIGVGVSENLYCECSTSDCQATLSDPVNLSLVMQPTYYDIIPQHFRNRYCNFDPTIYRKLRSFDPLPTQAYSAQMEGEEILRITSVYNPTPTSFDEAPVICECPKDDDSCKQSLRRFSRPPQNLKPLGCPDPTSLKKSIIGEQPVEDRFERGVLKFHRPAIEPSLLEPRHFRKIISGTCESQVSEYEECSQFAYETSRQVCLNAPAKCLNNTDWGQ